MQQTNKRHDPYISMENIWRTFYQSKLALLVQLEFWLIQSQSQYEWQNVPRQSGQKGIKKTMNA
ncbi:MAG: hypothetical protein WKF36_07410 [Candidatus Nitrosocosmicus sp.]